VKWLPECLSQGGLAKGSRYRRVLFCYSGCCDSHHSIGDVPKYSTAVGIRKYPHVYPASANGSGYIMSRRITPNRPSSPTHAVAQCVWMEGRHLRSAQSKGERRAGSPRATSLPPRCRFLVPS
jgi:hypothetical protein